jgi:hypothetical protein
MPNTDSDEIKARGDPGGIGATGRGVGVGVAVGEGVGVGVGVGVSVAVGVGSELSVFLPIFNSFSGLVVSSFVISSCVTVGVSFWEILEVTVFFISSTSTSHPERINIQSDAAIKNE